MKKIYLTVDTECHDIEKVNQYIYGKVKDEEYGITKILELAKDHNIPVNFFVDVGESEKYGREFIENIVDIIHSYNQPVFFHLHPDYIANDSRTYLWEYSYDEQKQIIDKALKNYKSFITNDDRIVFRAGRYGVNSDTYDIISSCDERFLDLSYLCNNNKMCKISTEELGVKNIPTVYKNVEILPNTQFVGFDYFGKVKCIGLDASDATFNEFSRFIKQTKLKNIVFTMHSWHFIKKWFFSATYLKGDKAKIRKFKRSVLLAEKMGYEFEDLRNFKYETDNDELINLCEGKNKIIGLINNFVRFQKIARLNKKYFIVYFAFYFTLFLVMLLFILRILGVL